MFTKEEIRKLKRGDRVLFRRLFDNTSKELITWASLFVEPTEAQDIVQDVYIQVYTHPERIDENGELLHYLKVAVKNRCLNLLRHQKVVQKLNSLPVEESWEETEEREQIIKRLIEAVEKLPPICQEVLRLSIYENLRYEDISKRLQISVNTVKYHIKRAYRELKKNVWSDEIELFLLIFFIEKSLKSTDRKTLQRRERLSNKFEVNLKSFWLDF